MKCFLLHETLVFSLTLQVHRKIREDSDMAQDSLQCLAQLASMHGPIFPDESAQVSYLAHLVEGLLSMINGSVCHFARKLNIVCWWARTQLSSVLGSVLCGQSRAIGTCSIDLNLDSGMDIWMKMWMCRTIGWSVQQ